MGESRMDSAETGVGDIHEHVSVSICRSRAPRFKLAQRLNSKKTKMQTCCCHLQCNNKSCIPLSTKSEQDLISSIPCHAIFIFLDPILIGVLQVKYQNKPKSPFETHPVHMWTFLAAICIYSTVLGTKIHYQTRSSDNGYHARILCHVLLLLSGAISSASLVFIFLPRLLVFLLIIMFVSMLVIMARRLLRVLLWWVSAGILNLISMVRDNLNMLVDTIYQQFVAAILG